MHTRFLTREDIRKYEDDLAMCYSDNLQIMDDECEVDFTNRDELLDYLFGLMDNNYSAIQGIFDDEEDFLFGVIIYDSIRLTDDGNSAQLHLATCKEMWGKDYLYIYQEELKKTFFDVLYCMVPAFCRPVIGLLKKLDFEKTGYVPKALPYTNSKGITKMHDELIYVYQRRKNG